VTPLFVDTSVFLVAVGGEHEERESCRRLVTAAPREVRLHASVEAVQEFLFHRMRRVERASAVAQARALAASCVLHAFDETVLNAAVHLVGQTSVRGRDAVHAAGAIAAGFDSIVSLDEDFDGVPGLRRLSPAQALPG
jgi:predicted nucleic acid-binding protein